MDALLTFLALQQGTHITEFNAILYTVMAAVGTGTALFLKVVLCIGALWLLRKIKRENLLVPLSVALVMVTLSNLIVIRLQGIEI